MLRKKKRTKKDSKSSKPKKDGKSHKSDKKKTKKGKKHDVDSQNVSGSESEGGKGTVSKEQLNAALLHAALQEQAFSTDSQAPKWER